MLRRSPLIVLCAVALLMLAGCSGTASRTADAGGGRTLAGGSTPAPGSSTTSGASVTAAPPASSPASRPAPGPVSDLVRLCSAKEADATARRCDGAETAFSASTLYCSADLPSDVTGAVTVALQRNGAPVYTANAGRSTSSQSVFLSFSVGRLRLPAGTYACQFRAGARTWTGTASLTGPAGLATQVMACDGATMVRSAGVAHCARHTATLTRPRSVGCSALLTDVAGKEVQVLVRTPAGDRTASAGRQTNGIVVIQVAADARQLGVPVGPGAYSCTFLIAGNRAATVPFTVAG